MTQLRNARILLSDCCTSASCLFWRILQISHLINSLRTVSSFHVWSKVSSWLVWTKSDMSISAVMWSALFSFLGDFNAALTSYVERGSTEIFSSSISSCSSCGGDSGIGLFSTPKSVPSTWQVLCLCFSVVLHLSFSLLLFACFLYPSAALQCCKVFFPPVFSCFLWSFGSVIHIIILSLTFILTALSFSLYSSINLVSTL